MASDPFPPNQSYGARTRMAQLHEGQGCQQCDLSKGCKAAIPHLPEAAQQRAPHS